MKNNIHKPLRYDRISTYFKLNTLSFMIASISGIIYNVLMAFVPRYQGKLIDALEAGQDTSQVIQMAIMFFVLVLFIQTNRYLKRYYVRDFANRIVLEMRTVSFNNLITDDITSFNQTTQGDIMNKHLQDIKDSAEGIRKILTEVYDSLILMTGYLISLFLMDAKLTLIILIFVILSIATANGTKKAIYKATSIYKKTYSKAKDETLNILHNDIYYRGFGVLDNYYHQYETIQDDLEKASTKSMVLKNSLTPIYNAIALIGLFFVIYQGGCYVIDGTWLIGTFSAYLTTFVLVATKCSKMGKLFNIATTFKVSWKRCSPYLAPKVSPQELVFDKTKTDLEVSDLSFGYNDNFTLNHISFTAHKGEIIGVCGMIHSGKSTLGGALSGLYDYHGSIKLDDIELKDVRNQKAASFIAYAPSNMEIFHDTLNYNVSLNNKNSDITASLSDACFDKDVASLPLKDQEILSHSLGNLSGGQEKRLQIARVLDQKAELMILDDPFNAIDLDTSLTITDHLKTHYPHSIIILINNQKEILEKMDKILFLKQDSYLYGTYQDLRQNPDFNHLLGGR